MIIYKLRQKIYIFTVLSLLLGAYGNCSFSSENIQGYGQKNSRNDFGYQDSQHKKIAVFDVLYYGKDLKNAKEGFNRRVAELCKPIGLPIISNESIKEFDDKDNTHGYPIYPIHSGIVTCVNNVEGSPYNLKSILKACRKTIEEFPAINSCNKKVEHLKARDPIGECLNVMQKVVDPTAYAASDCLRITEALMGLQQKKRGGK